MTDDAGWAAARRDMSFRLPDSPAGIRDEIGMTEADVDALRCALRAGGPAEAASLVRDEWVSPFVIAGTPAECKSELAGLSTRPRLRRGSGSAARPARRARSSRGDEGSHRHLGTPRIAPPAPGQPPLLAVADHLEGAHRGVSLPSSHGSVDLFDALFRDRLPGVHRLPADHGVHPARVVGLEPDLLADETVAGFQETAPVPLFFAQPAQPFARRDLESEKLDNHRRPQ